jgi:hypothetical protein
MDQIISQCVFSGLDSEAGLAYLLIMKYLCLELVIALQKEQSFKEMPSCPFQPCLTHLSTNNLLH